MTGGEAREARLKRLLMRSNRRGIKEMDLILGQFAATRLAQMPAETLDLYEALLSENDHDLFQWVSGRAGTPPEYLDLITSISSGVEDGFARGRGA